MQVHTNTCLHVHPKRFKHNSGQPVTINGEIGLQVLAANVTDS